MQLFMFAKAEDMFGFRSCDYAHVEGDVDAWEQALTSKYRNVSVDFEASVAEKGVQRPVHVEWTCVRDEPQVINGHHRMALAWKHDLFFPVQWHQYASYAHVYEDDAAFAERNGYPSSGGSGSSLYWSDEDASG
jgi:hypothetical protein